MALILFRRNWRGEVSLSRESEVCGSGRVSAPVALSPLPSHHAVVLLPDPGVNVSRCFYTEGETRSGRRQHSVILSKEVIRIAERCSQERGGKECLRLLLHHPSCRKKSENRLESCLDWTGVIRPWNDDLGYQMNRAGEGVKTLF